MTNTVRVPSTASSDAPKPEQPVFECSLEQLAMLLIASMGETQGLWRLAIRFRFRAVISKWQDGASLPSANAGVESVALFKAKEPGPLVFDAAELLEKYGVQVESEEAVEPSAKPAKKAVAKKTRRPKKG